MLTARDIGKYFRRHPAHEMPELASFRRAAVIPCYNELEQIGLVLDSLKKAEKPFPVAVLLVINYPKGADPEQSEKLLQMVKENAFAYPALFALYLPELSGGVGCARRAGMDCFMKAVPPEAAEECMIWSLDGDTTVAPDYFTAVEEFAAAHKKTGAFTLGFHHREGKTPEEERSIRRYEAYLARYVEKLREAGSPYAFQTVGSAFAVRGGAYIRSGGMKERAAGEDFYFLQELAKTCGVLELEKTLVFPSPRPSYRVPFGTGKAVMQLLEGQKLPEIGDLAFARLKTLLSAATEETLDCDMPELPEKEFLTAEHFFERWQGIRRNTPEGKLRRAFDIWFDGLKTLRFCHYTEC